MKVAMQEVAKKLALWHTPTFRPMMSHDDLDPIMASAGFLPLPIESPPAASLQWREYAFAAADAGDSLPRPRLPFPRIDGLHLLAYKAFLSSLEHCISPTEVHNLFHVRAMPLTRQHDRVFDKSYRPMRDCGIDDDGIYVFRDGTIDPCMLQQINVVECSIDSNEDVEDHRIKGCRSNTSPIFLVPWDSLLPKRDIGSVWFGEIERK